QQHDDRLAHRLGLDHDVAVGALVRALTRDVENDGGLKLGLARNTDVERLARTLPGDGARDLRGDEELAPRGLADLQTRGLELGARAERVAHAIVRGRRREQRGDARHRRVLPVDLAAGGGSEVGGLEGARALRTGLHGDEGPVGEGASRILVGLHLRRHTQPTDPSMPISMSLLSSSAYSIGSSRAIGSMKPRTIIAIASVSSSPRLMR